MSGADGPGGGENVELEGNARVSEPPSSREVLKRSPKGCGVSP